MCFFLVRKQLSPAKFVKAS